MRSLFLVVEIAFASVLMVSATLLVASFLQVTRVDLGFEPRNLLAFRVPVSIDASDDNRYRDQARVFFAEVIDRITQVPGVVSAGVYDGGRPLEGNSVRYSITGFGQERGEDMVEMRAVSPGYFEAAGMRVIAGRPLFDTDIASSPRVALVNDVVAARYFPGREAVGRMIEFRGPVEIVGVVRAVRAEGPEVDPRPELYFAFAQHPQPLGFSRPPTVVVRVADRTGSLVPAIRAAIQDVLPAPAEVPEPSSFEEALRRVTAQRRFSASLMFLFGLLALVIGGAGVYAVMAFVVARRTREIGIRLAVGASAGKVLRSVLAEAGRHLVAGLGLGLFAAWALSGVFGALLFEVQPTSVSSYAVGALVLLVVGLGAATIPAIRATRVDPLTALRTE